LKAIEVVKNRNAKVLKAIIQSENVPFFINLKWKKDGEMFLHHGQMHQLMQAKL
jgi:hypothetical protein